MMRRTLCRGRLMLTAVTVTRLEKADKGFDLERERTVE